MLVALSFPSGIEASVLFTYLLVGLLGVGLFFARGAPQTAGIAAVHAAAGVLSVLAADLITLLIAWELLTLSAYFIIRSGGREARGAAFWYLAAQICAAALFFVAMVAHRAETGSIAVELLHGSGFMTAAVLIKTAMMPLHGWLIGSYTKAPLLGSFVLSAFATKVGVYTAARTLSVSAAGLPMLSLLGAAMAVVAVLAALRQHSARRLLSYHIISQVGYMLAGVGLLESDLGMTAGLFHAVNHIIYKGLLFLVVAVVAEHLGHDDLRRMGGLVRRFPLVFVCAVIGAAAIVGLPLTSGYASKELLKKAAGEPQTTLLVVASVGTALSFTKFVYLIFLRKPKSDGARVRAQPSELPLASAASGKRASNAVSAALVVLALLSVAIGVAPPLLPGVPDVEYYGLSSVLWGIAPAAAGVLLFVPLRRLLTEGGAHASGESGRRTALARRTARRAALARLRRAYRLDPQRAVATAVVGAFAIAVLLLSLG